MDNPNCSPDEAAGVPISSTSSSKSQPSSSSQESKSVSVGLFSGLLMSSPDPNTATATTTATPTADSSIVNAEETTQVEQEMKQDGQDTSNDDDNEDNDSQTEEIDELNISRRNIDLDNPSPSNDELNRSRGHFNLNLDGDNKADNENPSQDTGTDEIVVIPSSSESGVPVDYNQEEEGEDVSPNVPPSTPASPSSEQVLSQIDSALEEEDDDDDDDDIQDDATPVTDEENDGVKVQIPSPESTEENINNTTNNNFPSSPMASNYINEPPPSLIGVTVHPNTPIPNSDASLRILRKFVMKTSSKFPTQYGGTKVTNIFGYLFSLVSSSSADELNKDECCLIYKELVDVLADGMSDSDRNKIAAAVSFESHTVLDDDVGDNAELEEGKDDDVVIESILGQSGDTMSKARLAIAAFCTLIEIWSLQTKRAVMMDELLNTSGATSTVDMDEELEKLQFVEDSLIHVLTEPKSVSYGETASHILTSDMMSYALGCAEALVAHGCFDRVLLVSKPDETELSASFSELDVQDTQEEKQDVSEEIKNEEDQESEQFTIKAVNVVADSIFQCDVSTDKCELSVLKLLLTSGCRTVHIPREGCEDEEDTMLRGNHLLQTLRMCYRVYLKTLSDPNKTTARAALRQIVSSTFARLEKKNSKLASSTMKAATSQDVASVASHLEDESLSANDDPFGNTASPSYEIIEVSGEVKQDDSIDHLLLKEDGGPFPSLEHKDAYLVFRALCKLSMKNSMDPINNLEGVVDVQHDPALESKTLALDLLLEVLQRANTQSLLDSGPQLIYAVRNYLCHSLLKNCTSDNTTVVNLSLRLFVPLIRHLRSHLKSEIEAFLTNVFFVILSSKNSTVEHKTRVVVLFEEICSDPETLAEIFLNYDCDLSAVDLFQRIVNTLATVAKVGLHDVEMNPSGIFVGSSGATRAEKMRQEQRQLRLEAMKAMKQILSSLHECIAAAPKFSAVSNDASVDEKIVDLVVSQSDTGNSQSVELSRANSTNSADGAAGGTPSRGEKHGLVQIFDSKRKRREEIAKATLRFNQKPSAGISYASDAGIINGNDPADVAQYLLSNQDILDKTQIGEYLGREPEYQEGFSMKVLHEYLKQLDFSGLSFDESIRFYLSGFRLPGEAQKIDRIMEKFAERFTSQNSDVFPTADAAFILAFSVIMLNTDLHNPAIKEERRMTKEGFIRNNRGICNGKDLPNEFLNSIFDRIKQNPISLKEDDEAREKVDTPKTIAGKSSAAAAGFFSNHYVELDKKRESDFQRERDQILRNTESLLRQKKTNGSKSMSMNVSKSLEGFVRTVDSGLKDEYVTPMFDVTWGPALAVFSTAMESANGTMGFLLSIASDKEIEQAAENAASATEVCLDGFKLAVRIAALCGNDTARSAFVHALSNFSLLGTGNLMEHRHVRCVQTLLEIARDEGEMLGTSWEYIFKALSEIARLNSVHEVTTKAFRVEAEAKARRRKKLEEEEERRAAQELKTSEGDDDASAAEAMDDDETSLTPSDYSSIGPFDAVRDELFNEEMDNRAIDETNARTINENIPEDLSDSIYHKSAILSAGAVKDFIFQLCRVSRMEISGYGGHVGNQANDVDLTAVHYRQQHTLLTNNGVDETRYNQPDIYSLQKLVEVTHYNMDYRPRLVFADIWSTVSGHLTSTALHSNAAVAMYAVDSFRQLSTQFLKREELGVFEFQRKFLKPFEAVMSKCQNTSVKEFLLKSVEQIILLFGSENQQSEAGEVTEYNGLLRSGWRPILTVIGIASRDSDDAISNLGFSMLTAQLRASLNVDKSGDKKKGKKDRDIVSTQSVMRADRFVDLVDTLLMYVSGLREDKSALSIDHLVTLSRYLADDSIPLPQKTRSNTYADGEEEKNSSNYPGPDNNEVLELWWPILLGLSRAVGDSRPNIRIKALVSLLSIINQHFFASQDDELGYVKNEVARIDGTGTYHKEKLQTLQLIFRGILTPILEHAETANSGFHSQLSLPEGFIRYMTKGGKPKGGRKERIESSNTSSGNHWLETTFDHLMDGSISLALKCIETYNNDIMVEEVLAMFNNCLISDSGPLAVRGLNRLNHFVTCDLALGGITNDTWATVCHMLRRCLTVRGNPPIAINCPYESMTKDQVEAINDFVAEEQLLAERRYIGSNAAMIIGSLLSDHQYAESMGMHWYLFLIEGLGIGLKEWDKAASIMAVCPPKTLNISSNPDRMKPPQYAENALYGRKWMVRLLLKLMTKSDLVVSADNPSSAEGGLGNKSTASATKLLKDECEAFINSFCLRESIYANGSPGPVQSLELEYMTKMTCDLLDGICKLDDSQLRCLSSLTPTLTGCIQINDRTVRTSVQNVLQRIFSRTLLDTKL